MSEEGDMAWLRKNKNEDAVHEKSETPPRGAASEPATPPASEASPEASGPIDVDQVRESVIEMLRTIFDPEIPVNIYEIGLIYGLEVEPSGRVNVRMTLTSPMCPVAETLPPEVETKINAVPGVREVFLDVVWDPPWNPQMMSEDAKLLLGIS
jgi:FeS assembly SUF system protein